MFLRKSFIIFFFQADSLFCGGETVGPQRICKTLINLPIFLSVSILQQIYQIHIPHDSLHMFKHLTFQICLISVFLLSICFEEMLNSSRSCSIKAWSSGASHMSLDSIHNKLKYLKTFVTFQPTLLNLQRYLQVGNFYGRNSLSVYKEFLTFSC